MPGRLPSKLKPNMASTIISYGNIPSVDVNGNDGNDDSIGMDKSLHCFSNRYDTTIACVSLMALYAQLTIKNALVVGLG